MKKLILTLALIITFNSCTTQFQTDMESRPLTDIQIDELSDQFIKSISKNNNKTLAIMDFVNLDGSVSMLGKYLREEITLRLFKSINVSVVERGMLQEVMNEWDFGANGFVNEKTASRIGQLMGVEAITIGTISDLGNYLKINSRIIEVETGEIISVASIYLTKNDMITSLINNRINISEITEKTTKTVNKAETEVSKVEDESKSQSITFESQGIKFNFNKIVFSKSKHTLIMEGYVKSLETDKKLYFYGGKSSIVPENGNTYKSSSITIGRVDSSVLSSNVDIIEGLETHILLNFTNLDYAPKKIIRFNFAGLYSNSFYNAVDVILKPNIEIEILD